MEAITESHAAAALRHAVAATSTAREFRPENGLLAMQEVKAFARSTGLSPETVIPASYSIVQCYYSIYSGPSPEELFREAIRAIMARYRPYYLQGSLVELEHDHVNRGYSLVQVEVYEHHYAANRNVQEAERNAAAFSSYSVGGPLPLSNEPVANVANDEELAGGLIEDEQPSEIMPGHPDYERKVKELILTYRPSWRSDLYAVNNKYQEHRTYKLSVSQVERYEAHFAVNSNFIMALHFAKGVEPLPSEWLRDTLSTINVLKKLEWKWAFLAKVYPQGVPERLRKKVAVLTDKKDILKALFLYQNPKKPRKTKEFKPCRRFLEALQDHNNCDFSAEYLRRLESFYHGAKAREGGYLERFVKRHSPVVLAYKADERVLTHPLFKVEKCGEDKKVVFGRETSNKGFRLVVTTRHDVYFTHLSQRMNFGKLSFCVNLSYGTIESVKRGDNFRGNACPYISDQKVCMGDNKPTIMQALKEGRTSDALTELYATMTNYNPNSTPYLGLDHFFQKVLDGTLLKNDGSRPEIEVIE